jgi:phenylacetate-coenzyme A ligase PaaK-like adenylate-forming protein
MDTHLMLGNEAVARGAWEAGVQVAAAYPGVTALCTTPSFGLYLADKAKERGIDLSTDSKLRIGLFGAEPWPESGRDRLSAALGVDAFNEYGMGEFLGPGIARECPAGGAAEEDRPPLGPRRHALL